MKKLWILISLLVISAMLLAACQPAATPTSEPAETEAPPAETEAPPAETEEPPAETEEPPAETEAPPAGGEEVTITIWNQWSGDYLAPIEQAFKDYEAAHPGVTIDLSKPDDVQSALQTAIPAGEGPDIVAWANDHIGDLSLQGIVVPLDQYGIDQAYLESMYEPAAVSGVILDGQAWALPETQEGIALLYNKALVTEDYLPSDPSNLDELLAKAEQFQADKGIPLVCNQGFGGSDAYHAAPVYFGFGVPEYVDSEGNAYMNTPEALAAAEWFKSFSATTFAEASYDICNAAFQEGNVGAWWTGPWAVAGVLDAGIDMGILPVGSPFVGIKTMMLTSNGEARGNAEVALDIMKYFTSAEVQKQLALVNKTIPAPTEALNDPEVAADPVIQGFGAALNVGIPMANHPFAAAQWVPVGDATLAVWNGSQEPAEAMEAAQAAIEDAVSQMK